MAKRKRYVGEEIIGKLRDAGVRATRARQDLGTQSGKSHFDHKPYDRDLVASEE